MSIPKLQSLLDKEVTRKEFLQHMGIIVAGILGIAAMKSRFSQSIDQQITHSAARSKKTYGTRTYGG